MILTNNKKLTERGFTIVELLIVIIVIGILATLVLIAYNNVQGQARDTKRQSDATSIKNSSEAFKTVSATGGYPDITSGTTFQASLNGLSPKTVSVDTTVSDNINKGTVNASNPNYISAAYCGGTTNTTATGLKIGYWSETAATPLVKFVTTGTGC